MNKERAIEKYNEWMETYGDNRRVYTSIEQVRRLSSVEREKDTSLVEKYGMVITEENYWAFREQLKVSAGFYKQTIFTGMHEYRNSEHALTHFLHISEDKPGSMIAFTQSPEKGREDRQLRMKIGKYLNRYFSDVLTPEQIRYYANEQERGFGDKSLNFQDMDSLESILSIYRKGPESCMSKHSHSFSAEGHHPLEAYIGSGLKIAYLTRGDRVTARVIVNPDNNMFVPKIYGDEELRHHLENAGWDANDSALDGVRLQRIDIDKGHVCPYLDGSSTCVDVHYDYLEIVEEGEFDTNETDTYSRGYVGGDSCYCECCDSSVSETRYIEDDNQDVCDNCLDNYYRYAHNTDGNQDYSHRDNVVYCETDLEHYHEDCIGGDIVEIGYEYYRYDADDVVETQGDEWQLKEDCVVINDEWYFESSDRVVYLASEKYALIEDCVEIDGKWYLEDSDDVILDHNCECQLKEDCVEIDGEWYLEDSDDVIIDHNYEYQLKEDCVEIDGEWYLDAKEAA